jgi:predicted AlkP superfamily pyrophosphatase or phosphodiesterase
MALSLPFHDGRRLVDLVNELERRLSGHAPGPGLEATLAASIPESPTYVLVLFDGLGSHQLDHPAARTLRGSAAGVIAAPFPTTTTVSLATIANGTMPGDHGMIGHLMWLPEADTVVNVLKWVTPAGGHVPFDTGGFLPSPNMWERLRSAGIEPITIQPAEFERSPLTRAIYRGCRFEGVSTVDEAIEATAVLSRSPRRLIFTYFNQVDFAAHVWGQASQEYRSAMSLADTAWSSIVARSGSSATVVGTADHGHLDYADSDKILIRDRVYDELTFFGDARMVFVNGRSETIDRLGADLGVTPHRVDRTGGDPLWPGAHRDKVGERLPDAVLAAPPGRVLLPKGFDKRLIGYHGGLDSREVDIPLLVG